MERKLTAILSADVKDYSRLMEDDEEATVRTISSYREVFTFLVEEHRGRVVDSPGDNVLAEFASVVDAMHCAVEIQWGLKTRNAELPDHRKMKFRIGLNLGDVIVDGDRIYGDGVNVAARVESLAKPGGIAVSGTAYDQIKRKLAFKYTPLGAQSVKNIAEPIRVYRVAVAPEQADGGPAEAAAPRAARRRRVGLVLLLLLIATLAFWLLTGDGEPPGKEPLSLAVLPFTQIGDQPECDIFCEGVTQDLKTKLSKLPGLLVFARPTPPEGQPLRDLGVDDVLRGKVQKHDDEEGWQISAEFVSALSGRNVSSKRYEPRMTLSQTIGPALQGELTDLLTIWVDVRRGLKERKPEHRGQDMGPYEHYLIGEYYLRRVTHDANKLARFHFLKATEQGKRYARAKTALAETYLRDWYMIWSHDPTQSLHLALTLVDEALQWDANLAFAHALRGEVLLWHKRHDDALVAVEKALELDPGSPECLITKAEILTWSARPDEALSLVGKAIDEDPDYPHSYYWTIGHAHFLKGSREQAEEVLTRGLEKEDSWIPFRAWLALCYLESNRPEQARAAMRAVLKPFGMTLDQIGLFQSAVRVRLPYKDKEWVERVVKGWGEAAKK